VERRGYANYYFNTINRERVWDNHRVRGDFSSLGGEWTIAGALQDGTSTRIILDKDSVRATVGTHQYQIDPRQSESTQLTPEGSGGLLLALHQWRRLLTLGPERYGEVYYLGTTPLAGHERLVDVLIATHDVIETRFLFDPDTGLLLALEMYPDTEVDPCEVYFRSYQEVDGRQVPRTLEVFHGDNNFGTLQIDELRTGPRENGA
jgi:hypothetical protein